MSSSIPKGKPEMFAGLVGEVVSAYEKYTEADSTAIAAQFIVAFGNAVGSSPYYVVGETRHRMNEFLLVVGRSSRSRKGDGKNVALRPIERAAPEWATCVASGLSSAEGLIHAVRDEVRGREKKGEETVIDPGVADKRLLAVETEFSSVLRRFEQQGNTLSHTLRDAWDGKPVLMTLTKNSPARATGAHVSVIAHTTPEDLHAHLSTIEVANGLGNRFLAVLTDRAQLLPRPGRVPEHVLDGLVGRVRAALEAGRRLGELSFTPNCAALWDRIYSGLSRDHPGLAGTMLARSEAHVLRLSSLYSLLSQAQEIDVPHLTSALAFWEVVEASVKEIFAGRTGNRDADRLREAFLPGQRMSIAEIQDQVFHRHLPAARLHAAIGLLVRVSDEFRVERESTGGRDAKVLMRRPAGGWHDRGSRAEHDGAPKGCERSEESEERTSQP